MKYGQGKKKTRWQQNHPKAGAHYSPSSLFRGLTVRYSNKPGAEVSASGTPPDG